MAEAKAQTQIPVINVYRLSQAPDGTIIDQHGRPFDVAAYSRMKYSVTSDMRRFGRQLAEHLLAEMPELASNPIPPAFVTSYKAVAPPFTTVARFALDHINRARFNHGVAAGELVQLYRSQDYIEEYATLSADQRHQLLAGQTNTLRGRSLADYQVIIPDDIRVTGRYTAMVLQSLGEQVRPPICAYLAVTDETLSQTPRVENQLNTHEISRLAHLAPYAQDRNLTITRRIIKLLVKSPLPEVHEFIASLPDAELVEVARAIIDTDPALAGLYPEPVAAIMAALVERQL